MARTTSSDGANRPRAAKPKATLRDVAAAVGVTPMTVSNVINGRAGAVSATTQARVLKAIEQLHYQPHAIGRRLRRNQTDAVGMLILDDAPDFLSDPFTTNMVAGLANYATEHGKSMLLQGLRSSLQERAPLLANLETDGVCAVASGELEERDELFSRVQRLGQPLVVFQERVSGDDVCSIRQDDRAGARLLVRHLLDRGARRFYVLLPATEWPAMVEREAGFREAAGEACGEITIVRCGNEGAGDTLAAVSRVISERGLPDAIVGGNDRMAVAAMGFLQQQGIRVPEDVKVTGFNAFDNSPLAMPALTTVRSAAYEIGRRGGEELFGRLRNGAFQTANVVIPVRFQAGNTT